MAATIAALVETGSAHRPELATRLQRAANILRQTAPYKAKPPDGTLWSVPSQSRAGVIYLVDRRDNSCSCPDYRQWAATRRRGAPGGLCKHRLAVEMIARLTGELVTARPPAELQRVANQPEAPDLTAALQRHVGLLA